MRTTILTRILIATLLPVLLVLSIVIGTARSVIYMDGTAYAKEFARLAVKHITERMSDKLESVAILQDDISREMALLDFDDPEAKYLAEVLLSTLIISNRDIYSAWFAFEPGVFAGSKGRYFKTLLRANDEIQEHFDMSEDQLDDPEASPWYNVPLSSGYVYANVSDYYDFQTGEGAIHTFTMTYPIITAEGRIVGCVGLDMRYENLFAMSSLSEDEMQRTMLIDMDGSVLYPSGTGRTIWEYDFKNPSAVQQSMNEMTLWQEEIANPADGEKLLLCLYPLTVEHTDQTVYLYQGTPTSSLYSSFYSSMEIIIATGTLGTILLAFCVYFSTRGIVRHVKRITDSFYHVANHSAEVTLNGEHIPTYQTDVLELDILQAALISMVVQLRRAHELKLEAVEAEVEKEKLIATAQAKTNFFAAMSHEIRTPMNAILGISEIMLHEGNLSAEQERNIQDIKVSSDSLLSIINDILDISKLETGKMELHPEHYNFRALMDNIASLGAHLAADASLEFEMDMDSELPLCLYGDGTRLRQVLLNLIGNAVKFTREGMVCLRISRQDRNIRYDVIDTGIGIQEYEINNIFQSFKQLDTRRNRDVKGTGLGLSISKNLIEIMGGTITVTSTHGVGSTFSVTVPFIPGDESKLRQARNQISARYSDTLRVLVVDDNAINLNVSSGLLRTLHGIKCHTAPSGWKAIEMVQETDYDIIFMDHMMPELDGVDTTQRIRGLGKKYQKIPIIALTANAVIGIKNELLAQGMDDYLTKPIKSDNLREILEMWVPAEKRLQNQTEDGWDAPRLEGLQRIAPSVRELLSRAGVDIDAGLENIGYSEEMYLQSLTLFRERLELYMQQLQDWLERGEMQEFKILVHGMKGSMASIGMMSLSESAKSLETASASGDKERCRMLLPAFFQKLTDVRNVLDRVFPEAELVEEKAETETAADEAVSGGELERYWIDCLQKLYSALEQFDYESITEELNEIYPARFDQPKRELLSQVKILTGGFDYPAAMELIQNELADKGSVEPVGD